MHFNSRWAHTEYLHYWTTGFFLFSRLRICSWLSQRRPLPSTVGLRMLRRTWQTLCAATHWRKSKPWEKLTMLSVPPWVLPKLISTSWQSSIARSRASVWPPTPTLGSLWRLLKKPGGICRKLSRQVTEGRFLFVVYDLSVVPRSFLWDNGYKSQNISKFVSIEK